MNKAQIDKLLPKAVEVLKNTGIANDKGEIVKTYRGQISTMGAAISSGSLLAAVSYFATKGNASVDRKKLCSAIYELITETNDEQTHSLFDYVKGEVEAGREKSCKEAVVNAAIALKLAMNVYTLTQEK